MCIEPTVRYTKEEDRVYRGEEPSICRMIRGGFNDSLLLVRDSVNYSQKVYSTYLFDY